MKRIEKLHLGNDQFLFSYRTRTDTVDSDYFHAHQGLEFLFIHEGEGQVILEQQLIPLSAGTLIIFQPFQLHRVRMNSSAIAYVRSITVFDPYDLESFLKPFPQVDALFHRIWKEKLPLQVFQLGKYTAEFDLLFQRTSFRLNIESVQYRLETFILFLFAFLPLFQDCCLRPMTSDHRSPTSIRKLSHTEAIMEWVDKHFREPFNLELVADRLHLTTYHISRLFKEHTGSTISDYLTARRMKEACLLLASTDMPLSSIADHIGGFSNSYFSTLFKRHMDITPSEYRKSLEIIHNKI